MNEGTAKDLLYTITAFWSATGLALGGFASSVLAHPLPLIFTADSFLYLYPAVRFDTGASILHDSIRGIGEPAILAALLSITTLKNLPIIQLFLLMMSIASLSTLLFLFSVRLTHKLSTMLRSIIMGTAGFSFVVLLCSHDEFVLNIYALMAEAPHIALSTLGLLLFAASWLARRGSSRLRLALAAAVVMFLSTLTKPVTLVPLALVAASLVWMLCAEWHYVRRRGNLFAVASAAIIIIGANAANNRIAAPQARYFGPQTLFCNHIPVVLSVVGEATPERAELSRLLRGVLAQGPGPYRTLGEDGDRCMYSNDVDIAIERVVEKEHSERARWLTKEFILGITARPLIYLHVISREFARYFHHPIVDIDVTSDGHMPDDDWSRLASFSRLFGIPRSGFTTKALNWPARDFLIIIAPAKRMLDGLNVAFLPIALGATILATISLIISRSNRESEIVLLCIGTFTFSYAMTIALSHSFDIGRYLSEMLPLTLLWLFTSAGYLLRLASRIPSRLVCGIFVRSRSIS